MELNKNSFFLGIIFIMLFLSSISLIGSKAGDITTSKEDSFIKHINEYSDLYKTKQNTFKQIIYPTAKNIFHEGKYMAFEDYVDFIPSDVDMKIKTKKNKEVIFDFYFIKNNKIDKDKVKIREKGIVVSYTKERGYIRYNITKPKSKSDEDVFGLVLNNTDCILDKKAIVCDDLRFDFSEASDIQNLSVVMNGTNVEFSGQDLSYIDPVITYNSSGIIDDSFAVADLPSNNYGSLSYLRVGGKQLSTGIDSYRAYVKFNLTKIAISDSDILTAKLFLYKYLNGGVNLSIYRVYDNSWLESTLNWTNQPCGTNFNLGTKCNLTEESNMGKVLSGEGWQNFSVINSIHASLGFGNTSISWIIKNSTSIVDTTSFTSSEETTNQPYLELSYYDLLLNTPSSNDEVLNTKQDIVNISTTGYNQSIWFTIDKGKTNTTICSQADLSCSENQTTFNYPYQGYFNLTVYANKSDSSVTSKTATNIFIGNRTTREYNTEVGLEATYCPRNNAESTPIGITPSCTDSTSNYTNRAELDSADGSYLTMGGGSTSNYMWFKQKVYINPYGIIKDYLYSVKWKDDSYNDNVDFYLWNYTGSSWTKISTINPLTTDQTNIINMTNFSTYINASDNSSIWMMYDTGSSGTGFSIDYVYFNITYYSPQSQPNTPSLITPASGSAQTHNNSIFFNWTGTDPNSDNVTYVVYFGQSNPPTGIVNITYNAISGNYYSYNLTNTTGFYDGVYYWKVSSFDAYSENITSTVNAFQISINAPAIVLNYPNISQFFNYTNNIYFNFTATDSDGVDTCYLWSNWTGTWHKNQTFFPTSGIMNYTIKNLTEGGYTWNVQCNDTLNNIGWSINRTIGVDLTKPFVNISSITTTIDNTQISFQSDTSDSLSGVSNCYYSIYNSSSSIDGLNNEQPASCTGGSAYITTLGATYSLYLYAKDVAGNINYTIKNFTVEKTPSTTITLGGGGGGIITILQSILSAGNYSFGQNVLDFVMAKGSVKPRTKTFSISNQNIQEITINLVCDTSTLEANQTQSDICNYVTFEKSTLILSPNELTNTIGKINILTPPNASFGDVYDFNLLALYNATGTQIQFAKLSISTRVPIWGLIYKWSYIPLNEKSSYPVFPVALFLSFILFAIVLFIFRKLPLTSFLVGLIVLFSSLASLLIYL